MKIAVFGRPGGGKSTLSMAIARVTGLPLHQLDLLQFAEGGARLPDEVFLARHDALLAGKRWVVDGFGTPSSFRTLLAAAEVLVYVDRPMITHCWWVTKRLLISPLRKPLGWPKGSPMLRSTFNSYRYLQRSHRFWTPAFKDELLALRATKQVHVVSKTSEADALLSDLQPKASLQ